jgi:uncharacterized protein (DUF2164 family)
MSDIEFSKEEKEILVQKIKAYFNTELDQDIGQFDCEFFLDFISEQIGAFYYNKGLSDAQTIINGKMADIADAFYEIEKMTSFSNR